MRPMLKVNTMNLKHRKSVLLGTSALVCLALAAPVMATDFVITSGTNTNGQFRDGHLAPANINDFDGSDNITLTGDLTTTGTNEGIKTTNGANIITVSETGSITTGLGSYAYNLT